MLMFSAGRRTGKEIKIRHGQNDDMSTLTFSYFKIGKVNDHPRVGTQGNSVFTWASKCICNRHFKCLELRDSIASDFKNGDQ